MNDQDFARLEGKVDQILANQQQAAGDGWPHGDARWAPVDQKTGCTLTRTAWELRQKYPNGISVVIEQTSGSYPYVVPIPEAHYIREVLADITDPKVREYATWVVNNAANLAPFNAVYKLTPNGRGDQIYGPLSAADPIDVYDKQLLQRADEIVGGVFTEFYGMCKRALMNP